MLTFTWWELHIGVGSKYRAIQVGTNGCSLCRTHHYKLRDEHLFLTVIVLLCQVDKLVSSLISTPCLQPQLLEVHQRGMKTLIRALLLQNNSFLVDSSPCPYFYRKFRNKMSRVCCIICCVAFSNNKISFNACFSTYW